jgi:hypothetical protein
MMKKIFWTVFISVALSFQLFGQGPHNVIFFTEGGEAFTAYVNGVQQNDVPTTNVKLTDLQGTGYQLKILFEDAVPGEFTKHMPLPEGSTEMSFALKKNKKGKWVARFISEAPYPAKAVEREVEVRQESRPVQAAERTTTNPGNRSQEVITTTTTTNTDVDGDPSGIIDIRIKAGEDDFGMNISVDDKMHKQTTTVTSETVVTSSESDYEVVEYSEPDAPKPKSDECDYPMADSEFANAKETISSKSFEDSKLSIAKQITRANCLSSLQVKQVMELFAYEETRLEYAKFAYKFTHDKRNYYMVNDAFQFEMTIDELDEFINE